MPHAFPIIDADSHASATYTQAYTYTHSTKFTNGIFSRG